MLEFEIWGSHVGEHAQGLLDCDTSSNISVSSGPVKFFTPSVITEIWLVFLLYLYDGASWNNNFLYFKTSS
jgi:hypothetical protein